MNLSEKIKNFVGKVWGSSNLDRFPGPQPISIERRHFNYIKSHEYLVCQKTDGVRHILVCFVDPETQTKICALVNRSFQYKLYSLTVHKNTLLDGELIGDTFIVHDAVTINGNDMRSRSLTERLAHVKALCNVIVPGVPRVVCKKMVPLKNIGTIDISDQTLVDGLIFTPVNEPVRMGTHRTMFKWKEMKKNTVDFIQIGGWLCIQNDSRYNRIQKFEEGDEGKIYECVYESEMSTWRPIIIRVDKSHPNNLRTFERTKVNISENIIFDELKDEFGKGN